MRCTLRAGRRRYTATRVRLAARGGDVDVRRMIRSPLPVRHAGATVAALYLSTASG